MAMASPLFDEAAPMRPSQKMIPSQRAAAETERRRVLSENQIRVPMTPFQGLKENRHVWGVRGLGTCPNQLDVLSAHRTS